MKIIRNLPSFFWALCFGFTLICGMTFASHAGAQVSSQDCEQYNLDVDNDGYVGVSDSFALMKCVKTQCGDLAFDVNGDGKVDETDYQIHTLCMKKGRAK